MASAAKVELVDWQATAVRHHTERFSTRADWRVVRRGENISLRVVVADGDVVVVRSAELKSVYSSAASRGVAHTNKDNGADLELPVDLPLGAYEVELLIGRSKVGAGGDEAFAKSSVETVHLPDQLLVTANAWHREDTVYLSVEAERQEYVLATYGRVYAGDQRGMPWRFGLYREHSVQAVLAVLAKCRDEDRHSVVRLTRRLTSLLNSEDNNGVLVGNWSGDYDDGMKPWKWQGSAAILEEFITNGEQPVKYGQCWVFSGLYTSVMRILGIPCRSVTNFDSAHDTDSNRSIDSYFNEAGEPLDDMTNDSIWNFHVWNEAWMRRPDLPAGLDGWQALDATPQEYSKVGNERREIFRMGPAPVKAVQAGVKCSYDTNFVIAEVNADIKEWVVKLNSDLELSSMRSRGTGTAIVTKEVGGDGVLNITNQYKYGEDSVAERAAVVGDGNRDDLPVEFELVTPARDELPVGAKARIALKMRNKTDTLQKLNIKIHTRLCSYTGRTLKTLTPFSRHVQLTKEAEREVEFVVTPAQYSNDFKDKVVILFNVFVQISSKDMKGEAKTFSKSHGVVLQPPELRLKVVPEVGLGKLAVVYYELSNPLRSTLTNIEVEAESDGLLSDSVELELGNLGSAETITGSFLIRGQEVGEHELQVSFSCDQLTDTRSIVKVNVVSDGASTMVLSEGDDIAIEDVDFKVAENRLMHHTDEYDDQEQLILRRGQPAATEITLSQQVKKVDVSFQFKLRKRVGGRGPKINLQVMGVPVNNKKVQVSIPLPADMLVGRYKLVVGVRTPSQHTAVYDSVDQAVVLFNPWCKDDEVYMEDAKELKEYVLNEQGGIWVGSYRRNRPMRWDFGQFDSASLATAMFLIERMPVKLRHISAMVTRFLSSALNSEDNNGVLEGNWSGDYSGGASPTDWIGSVPIFEQYMNSSRTTRKKPVKYGQCFIFSGIFTSAMRALGIPSRCVTNFRSAHDTHFNRAIDRYFDTEGKEKEDLNSDSVWNFHVWNEGWMKRSDLPFGFGGWQAVDATPQEMSENVFCCGPAPLRAVKMGNALNYDLNFIIAEVNADRRTWVENASGEYELKRVDSDHVGKEISTKAVGSMKRNDITDLYKFSEGSREERGALGVNVSVGKSIDDVKDHDISFDIDAHEARLGEDVTMDLSLRNNASQSRTFEYRVTACPLLYTGKGLSSPFYDTGKMTVTIPAQKGESISVLIKASTYLPSLKPHQQPFLQFCFFGVTKETGQSDVQTDTVELTVPELQVSLVKKSRNNEILLGQPVEIKVSADLSLSTSAPPIHQAVLTCQGRGLARNQTVALEPIDRSVPFNAVVKIVPTLRGTRTLTVGLACAELANVDGSLEVTVV